MEKTPKKSSARAIVSFALSLLSFLPLLNYITIPMSLYHGIKSLKNIKQNSDKYGGKTFAIIGITISGLILIFTLGGFMSCLAGNKGVCNAMGILFLSS
jgi:hypothetical protein